MDHILYSNYIKSNTLETYSKNTALKKMFRGNKKIENEFKNNIKYLTTLKSYNAWKTKEASKLKTICGTIRLLCDYIINSNLENKQILLDDCFILIMLSNDSVVHIRTYKKEVDWEWWKEYNSHKTDEFGWHIQNKWKGHSGYSEKEEEIATYLLENTDKNVIVYNIIYKIVERGDDFIKKLCKLIIWMTYKIDKKCYEYEQIKKNNQ